MSHVQLRSLAARLSLATFALLTCIDLCIYLWARDLGQIEASAVSVLRDSSGATLPALVGFSLTAESVRPDASSCEVVRYSSAGCKACRADDQGTWGDLGRRFEAAGCTVYIVLPTLRDSYLYGLTEPPGAKQVAYVDMEWAKRFRLTFAPTTMLISKGRLAWYQEGELAPQDLGPALAVTVNRDGSARPQ